MHVVYSFILSLPLTIFRDIWFQFLFCLFVLWLCMLGSAGKINVKSSHCSTKIKWLELELAFFVTVGPPARCRHGACSVLSAWMNPSKATHTATASLWKTTAFIRYVAKDLSPPLSSVFCMQAGAAMWKRGLRHGKGGWSYQCRPHNWMFSLLQHK